jgi:hypothetical protein
MAATSAAATPTTGPPGLARAAALLSLPFDFDFDLVLALDDALAAVPVAVPVGVVMTGSVPVLKLGSHSSSAAVNILRPVVKAAFRSAGWLGEEKKSKRWLPRQERFSCTNYRSTDQRHEPGQGTQLHRIGWGPVHC